jgi:hypothetical protein
VTRSVYCKNSCLFSWKGGRGAVGRMAKKPFASFSVEGMSCRDSSGVWQKFRCFVFAEGMCSRKLLKFLKFRCMAKIPVSFSWKSGCVAVGRMARNCLFSIRGEDVVP